MPRKALDVMPTSEWRQEFLSGISIASMVLKVFILRACSHNNGGIGEPCLLTKETQVNRSSRLRKCLQRSLPSVAVRDQRRMALNQNWLPLSHQVTLVLQLGTKPNLHSTEQKLMTPSLGHMCKLERVLPPNIYE
jgi:hypothetical protein